MQNRVEDIQNLKILAFQNENLFKERIDEIVLLEKKLLNKKLTLISALDILDITTLKNEDYKKSLENIVKATQYDVNGMQGTVAGLCIYSNLLPILNTLPLNKDVKKVVVSGAFPTGQMSLQAKISDIEFAVKNEADEVDVPINRGLFFENQEELRYELIEMKKASNIKSNVLLKIILETGELKTYENIYTSAMIAMECGADFVKTSTGKFAKGADIYSSVVMLMAINDYQRQNPNKKIGFKAAGGIRKVDEVMDYFAIMKYFMGEDYLNKGTFRIGCSRLKEEIINNLT